MRTLISLITAVALAALFHLAACGSPSSPDEAYQQCLRSYPPEACEKPPQTGGDTPDLGGTPTDLSGPSLQPDLSPVHDPCAVYREMMDNNQMATTGWECRYEVDGMGIQWTTYSLKLRYTPHFGERCYFEFVHPFESKQSCPDNIVDLPVEGMVLDHQLPFRIACTYPTGDSWVCSHL